MDAELKFDREMREFKLAREYLATHNEQIKSTIVSKNTHHNTTSHVNEDSDGGVTAKDSFNRYLDFLKEIEKKQDLIIELESFVRHVSEDETRFNLKVLLSEIDSHCVYNSYVKLNVFFDKHTPLSAIAAACQCEKDGRLIIVCDNEAAPLVHLLKTLLMQCGYDVETQLVKAIEPMAWIHGNHRNITNKNLILDITRTELGNGCIGVVTESADVDSAVDVFLSSFVQKPWKIEKILVQENVYDSFKNALDWKSQRHATIDDNSDNAQQNAHVQQYTPHCAHVYSFEDKLYLVDCAIKTAQDTRPIVLVEAYRTTQELLSLLKTYSPFGISLWCNDISDANTISYKSEVSLVWVNEYGFFKGCSDIFYSKLFISLLSEKLHHISSTEQDLINYFKGNLCIDEKLLVEYKEEGSKSSKISLDNRGQCVTINTFLILTYKRTEEHKLFYKFKSIYTRFL